MHMAARTETEHTARLWLDNQTEVARTGNPHKATDTPLRRLATGTARFLTRPVWTRRLERLDAQASMLAAHLRASAAGSAPGRWGVLSGVHGVFLLEDTLISGRHNRVVAELADWAIPRLPGIRAHAALSLPDSADLHDLERRIHDCAFSLPRRSSLGYRLVEHLPEELRPPIETVRDLDNASTDRVDDPVVRGLTLHQPGDYDRQDLTYRPPEAWLDLHSIHVVPRLRGLGLGTAALIEICRYADVHRYPIAATIQNHKEAVDPAFLALARLYTRLGFATVEPRPNGWQPGDRIRRTPR